jgi:uncharacterized protein YdaU (DUF1376 family)
MVKQNICNPKSKRMNGKKNGKKKREYSVKLLFFFFLRSPLAKDKRKHKDLKLVKIKEEKATGKENICP